MKRILLADDSITIQKVVELTFSDGDYQVFCVSNGAQALRKIPEVRPDIVLLDVIMPERNGYEVCEQMRAEPSTASIPVLLLTGTFEPFDRRRAEAAGASGHLTKPFESHTLVSRVKELLGQTAGAVPAAAARQQPSATHAETPFPRAAVDAATLASATRTTGSYPNVMPPPPRPEESSPAPAAFPPPDDAAGGSYLGFADLGLDESDEGEGKMSHDRYDQMPSGPSTVRISRDEALGKTAAAAPEGSGPMEGFVPGYEMPDSPPHSVSSYGRREEPMGAPPADPGRSHAGAAHEEAGSGDLSQEALDRIADLVVRKMADRVVREIAWEVIPGVAEAIVRQRIKEIEERER